MKTALKIVLGVLALPVVLFVGALVYGFIVGVTGHGERRAAAESQPESVRDPASTASAEPVRAPKVQGSPKRDKQTPDADQAVKWLLRSGLLSGQGEELDYDEDLAAKMGLEQALQIHEGLKQGGRKYRGVRVALTALASFLAGEERRAFATQSGLVLYPGAIVPPGYWGDFNRLLQQVTSPSDLYRRAVRNYCEVLTDEEMLVSLKAIGAYHEDASVGKWHIRVEDKMKGFDAETLLAVRGAIDDRLLGDRKYLRARLADLAKSRTSR